MECVGDQDTPSKRSCDLAMSVPQKRRAVRAPATTAARKPDRDLRAANGGDGKGGV
jgi:hypothetical protein